MTSSLVWMRTLKEKDDKSRVRNRDEIEGNRP